jgi:hypothetical protein
MKKNHPQYIPIRSFEDLSKVRRYTSEQRRDNLIIDYDDLKYIRIMKRFQNSDSFKNFDFFKNGIEINDCTYEHNSQNPEYDSKENLTGERIKNKILEPFHLRYYLPKNLISQRTEKVKKLVVMFNGMDESENFLLYDHMGECFVNNGMAAVLIPTQLHLNRKLYSEKFPNRYFVPTGIAKSGENNNANLFYYHFIKSWFEIRELEQKINNTEYWEERQAILENALKKDPSSKEVNEELNYHLEDRSFYQTYFGIGEKGNKKEKTELNIVGYSLGGLRALSFFLNDIENNYEGENKSIYNSCITINTCPDLRVATTESVGISQEEWKLLLNKLEVNLISLDRKFGSHLEISALNRVFKNIYFPAKEQGINLPKSDVDKNGLETTYVNNRYLIDKEIKEILTSNINKYLAIASGSDEVVNSLQIDTIAPRHKSIHKITVAGVSHLPVQDPNWEDLISRIENNIVEFINTCNIRHNTKNEVVAQLVMILIEVPYFNDEIIKNFIIEPHNDIEISRKISYKEAEIEKALEDGNIPLEEIEFVLNLVDQTHRLSYETVDFTQAHMNKLLNSIYVTYHPEKLMLVEDDIRRRFLNYFHLSKAFYPHFSQVIKTICKEFYSKAISDNYFKLDAKSIAKSAITFELVKLIFEYEGKTREVFKTLFHRKHDLKRILKQIVNSDDKYSKKLVEKLEKVGINKIELLEKLNATE